MRIDKTKWNKTTLEMLCTSASSDIVISKTSVGCGDYRLFGASGLVGNVEFFHKDKPYLGVVKDGSGVGRVDKYPAYSSLVGTMQYLHPTEIADIDFLKYLLISLNLAKYVKGAAIPHIYYRHYKNEKVLLPSLSEQQTIAKELDAVMAMIDGYKAHISDFDELAKSLFLDTLGDPVINEKKWQIKSLSSLCNKMSTGPFGSMLHKSDYVVEGIPSVNPQNIKGSKVVIDGIAKVSYQKAEELSKYYLKENDIILARRGDLSKCAIITPKEQGWLCGTGSFFLHIEEVLPIVFYYQFTSKSIQKQLLEKSIGATMPNLNQGILSKLMIPVPPIDIQQKFASQIEAIEKQKAILCEQLADAEQLMAERMQYYFS